MKEEIVSRHVSDTIHRRGLVLHGVTDVRVFSRPSLVTLEGHRGFEVGKRIVQRCTSPTGR